MAVAALTTAALEIPRISVEGFMSAHLLRDVGRKQRPHILVKEGV
jgi:hypothetical protein